MATQVVVVLQFTELPAVPPKETELSRATKSVPVMVTEVPPPSGPDVVVSEVMTGAAT